MKKTTIITIVLTFSLFLFLSACSTTGTENTHTTTIAPATAEITTEETPESTEQTEAPSYDFTYEAVYSGSWTVEVGDKDGFLLVTSRAEIDDFVKLDPESNEKYSSEWFETHALICVKFGHSSCDVARLNRIEVGEKTMIVYVDVVHDEEFYKEHGKEYEIKVSSPVSGGHTEAEGLTKFFIEFDKNGKEFVKTLKAAMVKWRDYPYSEWRAGMINLWNEEQ